MNSTASYSMDVTNGVDGDGHYKATLYRDGTLMGVHYGEDRDALIAKVKSWVEAQRVFDPTDVQRIDL